MGVIGRHDLLQHSTSGVGVVSGNYSKQPVKARVRLRLPKEPLGKLVSNRLIQPRAGLRQ
jgi:hypothetical protein